MTSASKKTHSKEIIGTFVSVILAVFFCYIAFRGINLTDFVSSLKNISILYLVLFIASTLFSHWLRALRWKILLRKVRANVSVHHSFAAVMIGYGANNVLPRLGEITRALLLGQYEGLSRMSALGSIMVERIIDTVCFGLSILIAGLVFSGNIYEQFPWLRTTFVIGLLLFVSLIAVISVLMNKQETVDSVIEKIIGPFSPRLSAFTSRLLNKFISGFSSLRDRKILMETGFLSVAIMLNYALSSYLAFFLFDMGGPAVPDFGMAWVVMAISAIGVMIPTPGGIGSYHSITRATLTGLYGFSDNAAIVYAFLSHGISYVLVIVIALAYFFSFRKKYGRLDEAETILEETNNVTEQ